MYGHYIMQCSSGMYKNGDELNMPTVVAQLRKVSATLLPKKKFTMK